MSITSDTRFESLSKINRQRLHSSILSVLKQNKKENPTTAGLTAREVAVILYNKGLLINNERQATAPRLTELVDKGKVVVVGKKKDYITNVSVAVYTIQ